MKNFILILIFTLFLMGDEFHSVKFSGDYGSSDEEFSDETLEKICHIEYPPTYKVWKNNPVFTKKDIKLFRTNLKSYMESIGYYDGKVDITTAEDTIYVHIKKNRAIKIHSLKVPDEFKSFMRVKVSDRFKTKDFTQTKKSISRFLEENGYPDYKMESKAVVDVDLYKVDVSFEIQKGEKRYFGMTDINNSANIDNKLIAEALEYKEGELYDVKKVEKSYDNLYRFGVFEGINIKADTNISKMPMKLSLVQGKTKSVITQVGYDTQDGVSGGLEYNDNNFFGDLNQLQIKAKGSLDRGYSVKSRFFKPQIIDDISLSDEVSYSDWDYESYEEKLLSNRIYLGKKILEGVHNLGILTQKSNIVSKSSLVEDGSYLINALFYSAIFDYRDLPMDAKNGTYYNFYIENASKALGSDIDYLKIEAKARYIKEFTPFVFASKLKVGAINKDVPIFKRLFAGGAMSNRGYEYQMVGEILEDYPLGGNSMMEGSVELRRYFWDKFAVVGFFDSTMLSQEPNDFNSEFYNSFGTGIRYMSPIGAVRLDVGFPQKGGDYAIHFGIGEVF